MKKVFGFFIIFTLIFSSFSLNPTYAKTKKVSTAFKMKEMARQSYNLSSANVNEWRFYKKKTFKDSLQYKIFRKKVGKKFDYTIAISGTDGLGDLSVDYQIIIANRYNTQIDTLEKEVNAFYKKEHKKINKLYFTGHSLGGFLATYVVSDIVEKTRITKIPKSKVKAYTYNAPGFNSTTVIYKYLKGNPYPTAVKVSSPISTKKIKNEKKGLYNNYIINYKIVGDSIAFYQKSLGKVIKVKTKTRNKHSLSNFNKYNI